MLMTLDFTIFLWIILLSETEVHELTKDKVCLRDFFFKPIKTQVFISDT